MKNERHAEFIGDLIELMERHGVASMGGMYDGDAYGMIHDEHFLVEFTNTNDLTIGQHMVIDAYDLHGRLSGT